MKILVTGGAGFIGSAVCRHLIGTAGATVLNVDKLTYAANLASLEPIAHLPGYHFHQADICDRNVLEKLFSEFKPDAVMHVAAESHVDRSITGSDTFIQTNIIGTYVLLEAARSYWTALKGQAREAFRFLHVSTDEVYGSLGPEGLFCENTPYDPSSPYSASKASSDHIARAWHRTYGLPVIVSNCSNNYGPYQFPEKLIPLIILNARDAKPLPVYGDGQNIRDWLYVEDHARALHLILTRGRVGETYNVGARNEYANISVVTRICELMDAHQAHNAPHTRLIAFVPDRPGHDRRYAIDATKLVTELGWQAEASFATGLEKTVAWFMANEAWWQPLRRGYRGERLGLAATKDERRVDAEA